MEEIRSLVAACAGERKHVYRGAKSDVHVSILYDRKTGQALQRQVLYNVSLGTPLLDKVYIYQSINDGPTTMHTSEIRFETPKRC